MDVYINKPYPMTCQNAQTPTHKISLVPLESCQYMLFFKKKLQISHNRKHVANLK